MRTQPPQASIKTAMYQNVAEQKTKDVKEDKAKGSIWTKLF